LQARDLQLHQHLLKLIKTTISFMIIQDRHEDFCFGLWVSLIDASTRSVEGSIIKANLALNHIYLDLFPNHYILVCHLRSSSHPPTRATSTFSRFHAVLRPHCNGTFIITSKTAVVTNVLDYVQTQWASKMPLKLWKRLANESIYQHRLSS
jgi:hypothetical protein